MQAGYTYLVIGADHWVRSENELSSRITARAGALHRRDKVDFTGLSLNCVSCFAKIWSVGNGINSIALIELENRVGNSLSPGGWHGQGRCDGNSVRDSFSRSPKMVSQYHLMAFRRTL